MNAATLTDALARHDATLAIAESYTGGLLHDAFTAVPGASRVLLGGVVAYGDAAKRDLLRVPEGTLRVHGAVSEPAALAMAYGTRHAFHATYALATTGIAGPTGATPAKPLGLAYTAAAGPHGDHAQRHHDAGARDDVRRAGVRHALGALAALLRRDGIL